MRETDQALFNTDDVLAVDRALIEDLKSRATRSPSKRFRLCLHRSSDAPIQQMIVVHCRGNYSRPHAHDFPTSMLVLEGEITMVLFDDRGAETRRIALGSMATGKPFSLELGPDVWHMPVCTSAQVVFNETLSGPFDRERVNLWAPWSPREDDAAAIERYLASFGFER